MSKMDDLRAMREARYAEQSARQPRPVAAKPVAAPKAQVEPTPISAEPVPDESRLCGHRAISGRTCTREHGHDAKSHRYS